MNQVDRTQKLSQLSEPTLDAVSSVVDILQEKTRDQVPGEGKTEEGQIAGVTDRKGSPIPVQLVMAVQESLFQKAHEWLMNNNAPEEIVHAFDNADYLQLMIGHIKSGDLRANEAAELPAALFESASLAVKFGDDFLGFDAGDPTIRQWKREAERQPA